MRRRNGTPDWIRTSDLLLRRQTLYPAELRAHNTIPIVSRPALTVKPQTPPLCYYFYVPDHALRRRGG